MQPAPIATRSGGGSIDDDRQVSYRRSRSLTLQPFSRGGGRRSRALQSPVRQVPWRHWTCRHDDRQGNEGTVPGRRREHPEDVGERRRGQDQEQREAPADGQVAERRRHQRACRLRQRPGWRQVAAQISCASRTSRAREEHLNATSPLFAGPPAAHGIHWLAVLAIVVGGAAAILLLWGLIRGRLPPSYAAAAVALPIAAYGLASLHMMEGSKQVAL